MAISLPQGYNLN